MAYERFVGQRYLMAKRRSAVVSIITLIAVSGVALGVTALIVVLSVMGGFTKDLTDKILGARAHIVIQAPDQGPLQDALAIADRAMEFDGILGASPFIENELMVSSPTNLSGVILRGVDIDRVGDVTDLLLDLQEGQLSYLQDDSGLMEEVRSRRVREVDELLGRLDRERGALRDRDNGELPFGSPLGEPVPSMPDLPELPSFDDLAYSEQNSEDFGGMPSLFDDHGDDFDLPELPDLEEDDGAIAPVPSPRPPAHDPSRIPGLIIGTELATSLNVRLGDEVNVVSPRGEMGPTGPIPRSRPFRVVGIFFSGMYEYDANHVYAALDDAARLLDFDGATGIELRTVDVDRAVSIADRIRAEMDGELQVLDWQELNSSLFFALRLEKIAMFVILTFIILVASFSIVAMLIMIVIEKGREIAILKSMGSTNREIMKIFIYQGVVIGTLGAFSGLILGLSICYFLATVGLPLDDSVYYISTLPVEVDPNEVVAVIICAIGISFLATLYPSYQAARLNPVEGLRYD